jgi:hypothetical protein
MIWVDFAISIHAIIGGGDAAAQPDAARARQSGDRSHLPECPMPQTASRDTLSAEAPSLWTNLVTTALR